MKLKKSLEDLEISKNLQLETALSTAAESAKKLLEESVATEIARGQSNLEETKKSMQILVDKADSERDRAKADLDNVEERWIKIKDEALHALTLKKDHEKEKALNDLKSEMKVLLDAANAEKQEYLELYTKENKARKAIHNKLLEIQGNIRVVCRVRPILEVEKRSGEDVDVTSFPSEEDITIQRDAMTKAKYEYDRVFSPSSTQNQVNFKRFYYFISNYFQNKKYLKTLFLFFISKVFEFVQPLCTSVLDGFNVCIFAYGQTGSGKTFTMEGYGEEKGVSPRAIYELFNQLNSLQSDWGFTLHFSMLEIYNETIRDLLITPEKKGSFDRDKDESNKLDIRQTPEGNVVPGLTEVLVTDPTSVIELMAKANSNRAVGSHDMNEHSSRSHSILTIVCRGKSLRDGTTTFGKLNLIDLAGSERVSKTDASGDRLKEAQNINRSLSALGDVINALGNKKSTHVPYRNSKLTYLLHVNYICFIIISIFSIFHTILLHFFQDSLGGNSKCLMFVNISPAVYNLGETICSLNFASRCRNVELGQAKKQSDEKSILPSKSSDNLSTPATRRIGTIGAAASALRK